MTIVFPKNNLPEPAQPWAREIQKQVSNVVASDKANEINNAARDNQLNSSLISLSKVVSDVKIASDEATEALDGLLGLSSTGSSYTLNANNIVGGTISGVNFITTGGSLSTTLSSGTIDFSRAGSSAATINAGTDGSNNYVQITSAGGGGQLTVGSDYSVLAGSGCAVQPGVAVSGRIDLTGTLVFCNANLSVSGRIDTTGNVRSGGTLGRVELEGGGTTGASINNTGNLIRTSSSERYKQDVQELVINYEDLLLLSPKKFRLKEEVIGSEEIQANTDARYYAGFIAEEIAQTPLNIFVSYEKLEDGTERPDGVYYAELTAALLAGIKHQDSIIKTLTARIETLESKVQ